MRLFGKCYIYPVLIQYECCYPIWPCTMPYDPGDSVRKPFDPGNLQNNGHVGGKG